MLRTKSILAPKSLGDGIRISIMSRHTENDGITPNPEITDESYDFWIPELAPPLKLVGAYYRNEVYWDQFKDNYISHIRSNEIYKKVDLLSGLSLDMNVTLLCVEETPELCHRRLLAEECLRYNYDLDLYIR